MFLQRGSRVLQKQWHVARGMGSMAMGSRAPMMAKTQRWFSESRRLMAIKPVVLADIGEGKPVNANYPMSSGLTNTSQASLNVKSFNGSWNPVPASKSSLRYAKSKVIRRLWRLQAASQAWSRSCTTKPAKWPKSASPLLTLILKARQRPRTLTHYQINKPTRRMSLRHHLQKLRPEQSSKRI